MLYLGDDDAIYDVIIQEPICKCRHNYIYEISRNPFADLYRLDILNNSYFKTNGQGQFCR